MLSGDLLEVGSLEDGRDVVGDGPDECSAGVRVLGGEVAVELAAQGAFSNLTSVLVKGMGSVGVPIGTKVLASRFTAGHHPWNAPPDTADRASSQVGKGSVAWTHFNLTIQSAPPFASADFGDG
ncbi:hypothetical protein [Streptomyces cinereoruber]|uniref:hypothetical protein n=1 Tax=Streptomyces cinereoruber TaxID=67260 RepID=UPI001266BF5F|nr:hypothetical protein [Streptomyces cinereoruber]MBB4161711.1 hypothetical protein [Streptomyces cinereoruber]MBY8820030.1 hypothetical protein [Streptomyces cinereoruber]NIH65396.1 hypothetical protein [Streptomyces cinereoruber]